MPKTTRVEVRVTDKDIALGIRKASLLCPIALALKRATGEGWRVCPVAAYHFMNYYRVALPTAVRLWVIKYDASRPRDTFKPFKFFFRLPWNYEQ